MAYRLHEHNPASILLQNTVNVHIVFTGVMVGEPGFIDDARLLTQ